MYMKTLYIAKLKINFLYNKKEDSYIHCYLKIDSKK